MSAHGLTRMMRRVAGLPPAAEYPQLERLLEREAGQVHNDYRLLARVVPTIVFAVSLFTASIWGMLGGLVLAGLAWKLLDWLDRRIKPSQVVLRQRSERIWNRYDSLSRRFAREPVLDPRVGDILEDAAQIYLKHSTASKEWDHRVLTESHAKAVLALEVGMGRLLQLGEAETLRAQEVELQAGWAMPILQEMRELDGALDHHLKSRVAERAALTDDTAGRLREARLDLERMDAAIEELDQHQSLR